MRHRLILLLIGAIASLVGFGAASLLRRRRCTAAGGQWVDAARECRLADLAIDVASFWDVLIGVAIALLAVFMLFRVMLFAMGRMSRPPQS